MAKSKLDKKRLNSYLSLAYPESIGFDDESDIENTDNTSNNNGENKGINNLASSLQRRAGESTSNGMAEGSSNLPGTVSQSNANVTPQAASLFQAPGGALPPVSFSLPDVATKYNPMLFGGNADINNVARAVLSEKTPTQQETVARMTPEEKLMATIANTNPTPSGFWKRLLVGAASGASQIDPNKDTFGSAFGRILGGAVTRAIPDVDSAMKYKENKARAIERYQLETGAANSALQRKRITQDIENDAALNRSRIEASQRQARIDAQAQADRLADNERAEAKLKLDALEKMGADDPNRKRAVAELAAKYRINVGEDYGVELHEKSGKTVSEDSLRKRAEAEITKELGANTEERARGAAANQLQAKLKADMPPDLYAALTDVNASSFKRTQALKMRDEIEDRLYKVNLDYTKSDFEQRVSARIEELRGGPTGRSNKPVTQSNKRVTKSNSKVAPSNSASTQDARTIKFR